MTNRTAVELPSFLENQGVISEQCYLFFYKNDIAVAKRVNSERFHFSSNLLLNYCILDISCDESRKFSSLKRFREIKITWMKTIFFGSFCLYIVNMSTFGTLQAEVAWHLSWTDAYIEFIAFLSRPSLSCKFIAKVWYKERAYSRPCNYLTQSRFLSFVKNTFIKNGLL